MEARGAPGGPILTESTLRTTVGALGAFHVLEGLYMLLAPGSFYSRIGTYGAENTHYVGDVGSFILAYGIAVAISIRIPSWRVPVLWVGALWYGLHAVNHVFDTGQARSDARGWTDTLLLAFGGVLFAYFAQVAARLNAERAR